MDRSEIIEKISKAKKKTPVKVIIKCSHPLPFKNCHVFGEKDQLVYGDYSEIEPILINYQNEIEDMIIETSSRNSAIELMDIKHLNARIEPGAIIREHVTIGKSAVIMMGAIINIGVSVGDETMVDMGAILGGCVKVGKRCHIGAGAVLAGVIEPANAKPVIIEDDVLIGANAVILEGIHIKKGAVIGAGAIVTKDVEENCVVAGNPARVIKMKNEVDEEKTKIIDELR